MNNKMAKIHLSTIESKKHTKQRRTETESWIRRAFDGARWEGVCRGMDEEVRGLRITKSYRITMGL